MSQMGRKVAADARRIAAETDTTEQAKVARDLIHRNYERGVRAGRRREREENAAVHPRVVLLRAGAGTLSSLREQMQHIPNSERSLHAFKEAEAILLDAAEIGEHG